MESEFKRSLAYRALWLVGSVKVLALPVAFKLLNVLLHATAMEDVGMMALELR